MLTHPATKYRSFNPVNLTDRTWINTTITHPPIWLSTDLRDGNQALIEPMNIQQKLKLFSLLVKIGFKEIEVAFPSASQTDFDFVRYLIENNLIPDDVKIQVLTPAREELIRRTFEALRGVKKAIVHLYNATSPVFRRVVFGLDRENTIKLAVDAAKLITELAANQPETKWQFQYSPETFTGTELEFAKEICDRIIDVWQPTAQQKVIINLPATVEMATPNIFADQVEWMHRHIKQRDHVILCVHTHNDRGCAVAAAELAQMAGAERVEGCLFGNGERTGNVDLVTLALNLYTQGIHPGLDFSNLAEVAEIATSCTQLPIHPRHPYAGDLVFTAFSGSHQDAIKKGFAVQKPGDIWEIPYLPLDPVDVGSNYESIVRVNSQSGKGGLAFLLERDYGLILPRNWQIQFSRVVQKFVEIHGKEISSSDLWKLFESEYIQTGTSWRYISHQINETDTNQQVLVAQLQMYGEEITIHGVGNGPIDAFINGLNDSCNREIQVVNYEERSLQDVCNLPVSGSNSQAVAFLEITTNSSTNINYGVGIHSNIVTASFLAILNCLI
ncbi:2-isopropylmalate synthase [Calothrix sp. PCC 6303]|uniref:2-isopropylmalate synthase n=1 Tax=Calothrix sp. PCC 6303 TaxID=1170562 RepID=UPI0002A02608|nr:2-isopropylmalate synthase [Calothrix sp. PCC 6303]AFZ04455.1 2-isopropylmalate synthase [Calothrix sp. PCC 6303]